MKLTLLIFLVTAVLAAAARSDVLTNHLGHTVDEVYSKEAVSIHRVLQRDSQRQRDQSRNRNNQNPNRNQNRDRNRNRNRDSNRNRNSGGVCTPFGSQCDPNQSNCCQGGCTTATQQCYCQENGGMCFNKGGEDNFCCSNKCGDDGKCSCIAAGEPCAVGGDFCCGGLSCDEGQCIQRPTTEPTHQPTPLPTPQPSPKPTRLPTPLPTPKPTLEQCRRIGEDCYWYGFNELCCSGMCGEDKTCANKCHRLGEVCFGIHDFCCSGLCGDDGYCVRMTKPPTPKPTDMPTSSPSDFPSSTPTVSPSEFPSSSPSEPPTNFPTVSPTPMPSNHPTLPPTWAPTLSPTSSPSESLEPTPYPTLSPTFGPTISASTYRKELAEQGHSVFEPRSNNGCQSGLHKLKVEIMTDKFGGDTAWSLIENGSGDILYSVPENSYDKYSLEAVEICVNAGNHTFNISDDYGDGVCCQQGNGYIKLHLDDREILYTNAQFKKMSLNINVGYDPTLKMKEREFQYLEAHNRRRKIWHTAYNTTYSPLIWSNELAESSRRWAETSLVNCSLVGVLHEGPNPYGENLAENKGAKETWGQLYPPDLIVGRWIDREVGLPYPSNAHLTAALYRASKYVGCGEAEKDWGKEGEGKCRVQVCRYARTCNCGMGAYKEGEDWLIPMLADTSKCGPDCPPEGCY